MYKYSDFSFRTSYGTAFKAPSFTNMYSHFTRSQGPRISDISGSEDLKPEESKTEEYAVSYNKDNLDIELVHHRTKLDNLANTYIVKTVGLTTYYTYHNVDKSEINGTELSLRYRFNNNFSLTSSIEYLDTEDKSTGERLTDSAKNTYKVNLAYEISKVGFYLDVKRLRNYYGADVDRTNKNTDYTIVDLKVNYDLSEKISFFLGIDNLQNKKMPYNMTSRGTPNDPGERFYYTGMSYKF
jgi:outer membrane receptor for ferrienterochelin and colicin